MSTNKDSGHAFRSKFCEENLNNRLFYPNLDVDKEIVRLLIAPSNDSEAEFTNSDECGRVTLPWKLKSLRAITKKSMGSSSSGAPETVSTQVSKRYVFCRFCKKNGESKSFCESHELKDEMNGKIVCPILRKHRCEICGATGDDAHTRSYCNYGKAICSNSPVNEERFKNLLFNSAMLKNSKRNCAGKLRKK